MKVSNHATHCIVCNNELQGLQKKFCSTKCKSKKHQNNSYNKQQERGLKRKIVLIGLCGGECQKCGYNKNYAAIEFHHRNASDKSFQLDMRSLSNRSLKVILEEIQKCDLLCANCHREIHHPQLTIR
jgi:hypothetical protein